MTVLRLRAAAVPVVALLVSLSGSGAVGASLEPPLQVPRSQAPRGEWPAPPAATATSYLLLDADSGQVLAERAADQRRPVASTIKVLTALTVLRRATLNDIVTVTSDVSAVGGARVGLAPGDRWTVRELLDGLLVRSGNDAAVALAVHVGGSVDGFLELMRADAAALGLDDPPIVSVNGLDDRNLLSARDLGIITRAALRDPRFVSVAAQPTVRLPGLGQVDSRNELLAAYTGATGVKTGYTQAAGWSLVGSATRGERRLVAVVLDAAGDDARFSDAAALLDHGFDTFERVQAGVDLVVRRAGQRARLQAGPVRLLVPRRRPVLEIDGHVVPIEWPQAARTLQVRWQDSALATIELSAPGDNRPGVAGAAGIGRYLSDRIYAGMRAAHRGEVWPPSGP